MTFNNALGVASHDRCAGHEFRSGLVSAVLVLGASSKPADTVAIGASATVLKNFRVAIDPTYEPFTYKTADGKLYWL